ncbi:MAG: metallophosphoesterase family protein [Parafilimonas sp.]
MKRIGIISDTHDYLDDKVFDYFKDCDEIWHAGDFGNIEIAKRLKVGKEIKEDELVHGQTRDSLFRNGRSQTILRGVYGNIDGIDIRNEFPKQLVFMCEDVKVMMRHIGGYPPKYNKATKEQLLIHKPQLFITGHSHILKIMYDETLQCLYVNPGAAGKQGWQRVRTIVTLVIDGKQMKDCRVIELGKK